MKQRLLASGLILSLLSASACGNTSQDRVLSGAGLGAAAGTATSVIVGGSVGTGLLLGTAAGAIAGGVTDSKQIDLGKPFWRQ